LLVALQALAQKTPAACQSQPAGKSTEVQSSDTVGSDISIAAAARSAKAQKAAHAKKVVIDEDMEVMAGPLPRLKIDGPENSDEVVAAIAQYKLTQPEQTEQAVHVLV
jgi:hypothetical protein